MIQRSAYASCRMCRNLDCTWSENEDYSWYDKVVTLSTNVHVFVFSCKMLLPSMSHPWIFISLNMFIPIDFNSKEIIVIDRTYTRRKYKRLVQCNIRSQYSIFEALVLHKLSTLVDSQQYFSNIYTHCRDIE